MNNKKLFEEAIAEAKSIREAAIANAKEALEESLTPQIKELLAQRLTEMEDEELPVMEEEEEEEGAEEAGEEKEAGEEAEEDMDIEDMSVEELKALIRDIVGQMVDQDGDGDHDMEDHDMEDMGMEEPAGEEAPEDEEIDLDELLAELSMEEEEPVMENPLNEFDINNPSLMDVAQGVAALFAGVGGYAGFVEALKAGVAGPVGEKIGKAIDLTGAAKAAGTNKPTKTNITGRGGAARESVNSELNEAKKTIKKLTESLQEVNLLNAKLLYVNKVMKENKNLSDIQVANVISTFDKAATVKEAKLVYESLSTSLVKKSNAPVVESKLKQFASKSTGKAPVKKVEVIAEVSDAVKRMQKLAGIIKN